MKKVVKRTTVIATVSGGCGRKLPVKRAKGRGKGTRDVFGELKELDWEVWERDLETTWGPWGDNDVDIDMDALVQRKLPLEHREPPPELLMPLLPFQKEWLAWSLKQERSSFKGGILADEMGMGKTIQAISLIVTSRYDQQNANSPNGCSDLNDKSGTTEEFDLNKPPEPTGEDLREQAPPAAMASSSNPHLNQLCGVKKELPQVKATLVVCPLVAVIQWRNEVARFTAEGTVSVLVYHGPRRGLDLEELSKYDIVLTTYSIVELEHRKNVMPAKEACKWCKKLYYPDKMAVHLRYFCGPAAQRTEKQAKQVKKMLRKAMKPSAVEDGDDSDFEKVKGKGKGKVATRGRGSKGSKGKSKVVDNETPSDLDCMGKSSRTGLSGRGRGRGRGQGRGRGKEVKAEDLEAALQEAMEINNEAEDKGAKPNSVLHSVKWGRIVLDEV